MQITTSRFCSILALVFLPMALHAQTNNPVGEKESVKMDAASSIRPVAVSELNGKISYSGGNMNSFEGHNFDGSIAFPICDQIGFQADGLYSHVGDDDFYGGAGHLFWRNPEIGLIGVTGGYLQFTGADTYQAGVEAEYYWNRFTFSAFAGVGSISYANSAPFIDTNPTRFVGRIAADYYPVDNLRVGVSCLTAYENAMVKGELEYQTPIRGLALTGEVAKGDHGYDHWLLGVRYYFGSKKTLIDRQRQDDPPSAMSQILQGLGLYGAEFNREKRKYLAHHGGGSVAGGNYGDSVTSYGSSGNSVIDNISIGNGNLVFGGVTPP